MKNFISRHTAASLSAAGAFLAVLVISACNPPVNPPPTPVKSFSTSITGTVKDRVGNLIDGVEVRVGDLAVKSAKDGSFSLKGVTHSGSFTLSAKKSGYKDYTKSIEAPQGKTTHNIQLAYGYKTTVTGRVNGPGNKSGITIKSDTGGETVQTGPDGRYTIVVEHAGKFILTADGKGQIGTSGEITPPTTPEKPDSEEPAEPIELAAAIETSLSGTVKDPLGNLLPGVQITSVPAAAATVTTDSDGAYSLTLKHAGEFKLTAKKAGYNDYSEDLSFPADGAQNKDIVLPFGISSNITAIITDRNGDPIDGADISYTIGTQTRNAVAVQNSAAKREYTFTVPNAGSFQLTVEKALFETTTTDPITVTQAAPVPSPAERTIEVPFLYTTRVRGTVFNDASTRVAVTGADVKAKALSGSPLKVDTTSAAASVKSNTTTGGYEITVNHQGSFTLEASKGNYTPGTINVTGRTDSSAVTGENIMVAFPYTTIVTGTISGLNPTPGGTNPRLSGAGVQALQSTPGGGDVASQNILVTGSRYTITVKHQGAFKLRFTPPPSSPGSTGPRYAAKDERITTTLANLTRNTVLPPGVSTSFTVKLEDPLGNAITNPGYAAADFTSSIGAAVEIDSPPSGGNYRLKVTTTGSGTFTITLPAKGFFGSVTSPSINAATPAATTIITVPYLYTTTVSGRVVQGGVTSSPPGIGNATITVQSGGTAAAPRLAVAAPVTTDNRSPSTRGNYSITVNHQGDFKIQAAKSGYASVNSPDITGFTTSGPNNKTQNISLGGASSFQVQVNDLHKTTNAEITGANFSIVTPSNANAKVVSQSPTSTPGLYNVRVAHRGSGNFTLRVSKNLFRTTNSGSINVSPTIAAQTIQMRYLYTTIVSGRVVQGGVTSSPPGIGNATITVQSGGTSAAPLLAVAAPVTTDDSTASTRGDYSITVNHQGDFSIEAAKTGYDTARKNITGIIASGIKSGEDISLGGSSSFQVQLNDNNKTANAGITGASFTTDTTSPATVTSSPVAGTPGRYNVRVIYNQASDTFNLKANNIPLFEAVNEAGISVTQATRITIGLDYRYTTTVSGRVVQGGVTSSPPGIGNATITVQSGGTPAAPRLAAITSPAAPVRTNDSSASTRGNYSITVNHQGDFGILAAKSGYASISARSITGITASRGTRPNEDFSLGGASSFQVQVNDFHKTTNAGITGVIFSTSTANANVVSQSPTSTTGLYNVRVAHRGRGSFTLSVRKNLFRNTNSGSINISSTIAAQTIRMRYLYTTTVSGRVVQGGVASSPPGIGNATITVQRGGTAAAPRLAAITSPAAPVRTNDSSASTRGDYSITVNHQGGFKVRAAKSGYASVNSPDITGFTTSGPNNKTQNISLGGASSFQVQVNDLHKTTNAGITGAAFSIVTPSNANANVVSQSAVTSTPGLYNVRVAHRGSGNFTLRVSESLFSTTDSSPITVSSTIAAQTIQMPYRYTTTVRGQVKRGSTSIGIANADISVGSTGSGTRERLAVITSAAASRRSDSSGNYNITVRHQGNFTVKAEKANHSENSINISSTGGTQNGRDIPLSASSSFRVQLNERYTTLNSSGNVQTLTSGIIGAVISISSSSTGVVTSLTSAAVDETASPGLYNVVVEYADSVPIDGTRSFTFEVTKALFANTRSPGISINTSIGTQTIVVPYRYTTTVTSGNVRTPAGAGLGGTANGSVTAVTTTGEILRAYSSTVKTWDPGGFYSSLTVNHQGKFTLVAKPTSGPYSTGTSDITTTTNVTSGDSRANINLTP